jgi:OTU-like cysteine protease
MSTPLQYLLSAVLFMLPWPHFFFDSPPPPFPSLFPALLLPLDLQQQEINPDDLLKDKDDLDDHQDLQIEILREKKVVFYVNHPHTNERLRAYLIKRNVPYNEEEVEDYENPDMERRHLGDTAEDEEQDGKRRIERRHVVRWGKFWLNEPGSDYECSTEDLIELAPTEIPPTDKFGKYLSFVQTVGSPGFEYMKNDRVECRDMVGNWWPAVVKQKEQNYYFVQYMRPDMRQVIVSNMPRDLVGPDARQYLAEMCEQMGYGRLLAARDDRGPNVPAGTGRLLFEEEDSSSRCVADRAVQYDGNMLYFKHDPHAQRPNHEMDPEWIHKYSTRLRRINAEFDGQAPDERDEYWFWESIYELDWVRVRHPASNQYLPAKVLNIRKRSDMYQPFEFDQEKMKQLAINSFEEKEKQRSKYILTVQYADDTLLIRQEQISLYHLIHEDPKKIEFLLDWKRRWEFNRRYVYETALNSVGLRLHRMDPNHGHSLFRALSHQLFGTPENFLYLRHEVLKHISKHKKYYSNFVDVNFEYYIAHKKKGLDGNYFSMGDHLDIQAVCEIFDARVEIFSLRSPRPLDSIRFYQQMKDLPVLRLSYNAQDRYDSISHVDSPLPITITKELRQVPLGNLKSKEQVILRARQDEFNRIQQKTEVHELQREEITVVTYHGPIKFYDGQRSKYMLELLDAVGLTSQKHLIPPDSTDQGAKLDDTDEIAYRDPLNPNIVIVYPARPEVKQGINSMRIEGTKDLVDLALRIIRANAQVHDLRQERVGSRVIVKPGARRKQHVTDDAEYV